MTQHLCPCGGAAYVDSFDWPKKPRQWFLRCEQCGKMSEAVATEEQAEALTIKAVTDESRTQTVRP